eukprot:1798556-Rhodomonas_salina.1
MDKILAMLNVDVLWEVHDVDAELAAIPARDNKWVKRAKFKFPFRKQPGGKVDVSRTGEQASRTC